MDKDIETGDVGMLESQNEISPQQRNFFLQRRWILAVLIILLGGASTAAFLSLGIESTKDSAALYFEESATEMAHSIESAWHDYMIYALWAHSCSKLLPSRPHDHDHDHEAHMLEDELRICTHEDFHTLFEQIQSLGLGLYSLQYVRKVEHKHRIHVEEQMKKWLVRDYDYHNFTGFTSLNSEFALVPQDEQQYYFPILFAEPFAGNEDVLGLDVYGNERGRHMIDTAMSTWKPSLSEGMKLVQDKDPDVYSVYLVHPGVKTSLVEEPQAVTSTVVRIPDLLTRAAKGSKNSRAVYLYDSTDPDSSPQFLGAMAIRPTHDCPGGLSRKSLPETALFDIPVKSKSPYEYYETTLQVVERQWTVAVIPLDEAYEPSFCFIVLGAILLFLAFLVMAAVARCYLGYLVKMNDIKTQSAKEKAEMALERVQHERRLNEYLAHEVRNPLASAMAALSFVSSNTRELVQNAETRRTLLDDENTVDSSLCYINDLLRSMLDMNKAANGQIKLEESPTDVLRDVLEPVTTILCMRGAQVEIVAEGPPDLLVVTDRLRLKQIVLNLSINATKFVQQGFIRLRAAVQEGHVTISVEDSGPGLPPEKRKRLFVAFQESCDLLHQGTGMGLYICSHLSTLMGAKIWLDESYQSGVEGCPGARFVIDLQKSPIADVERVVDAAAPGIHPVYEEKVAEPRRRVAGRDSAQSKTLTAAKDCPMAAPSALCKEESSDASPKQGTVELPKELKVLFVDDEAILRKLFIRSVKRVAPTWSIQEAASGDRALQMISSAASSFDIIFVDQYMPCIERPLLGTEVIRQLRSCGETSIICGLSANDLMEEFLQAGANGFLMKPFPCEKERLKAELVRLLSAAGRLPVPLEDDSATCTESLSQSQSERCSESKETKAKLDQKGPATMATKEAWIQRAGVGNVVQQCSNSSQAA